MYIKDDVVCFLICNATVIFPQSRESWRHQTKKELQTDVVQRQRRCANANQKLFVFFGYRRTSVAMDGDNSAQFCCCFFEI